MACLPCPGTLSLSMVICYDLVDGLGGYQGLSSLVGGGRRRVVHRAAVEGAGSSSWESTCPACTKPWFQSPALHKIASGSARLYSQFMGKHTREDRKSDIILSYSVKDRLGYKNQTNFHRKRRLSNQTSGVQGWWWA